MQQDGQWEDVKYQSNGSYLLLSMEGTEGTFCIASTGGKLILEPVSYTHLDVYKRQAQYARFHFIIDVLLNGRRLFQTTRTGWCL